MTPNEVIRTLMAEKGYSNAALASKLGYSTASGISEKLRRSNGMRIDIFLEILHAMDCEIIIKDKIGKKTQYTLDTVKEEQ